MTEGVSTNLRAVIQAGGKGTRMLELTGDIIPKPMLEIDGKPMVLWQMENAARYGISDFVIITGHLGEVIEQYFGDGAKYGFHIDYLREDEPLGSAGSLVGLKEYPADRYLLIFGDVMFDIDMDRMINYHADKQAMITLLTHPNSHPYDSDLLSVDDAGRVEKLLSKKNKLRGFYHNCVNAGIYLLEGDVIRRLNGSGKMDMEEDVVLPYITDGKVYAYSTPEYVKDAGTPDRFASVCREKLEGLWERKSLRNKQKAIFLDRDGTINKYVGLVKSAGQLELEENAADAIKLINKSGYLAIVITNQPVIARGDCTLEELNEIHNKLETLLGEKGAYLDAIYYCPHHPDGGYPGERKEYKIKCNCRKPETGLIDKAVERFNIDILKSFMVGDTTRDVMTGINGGLHTVLVYTGEAGNDRKFDVKPENEARDLLEAVKLIMKEVI